MLDLVRMIMRVKVKSKRYTYFSFLILLLVFVAAFTIFPKNASANAYSPASQTVASITSVLNICLTCDLIKNLLTEMGNFADKAKVLLIQPSLTVLGMGLAFWITIHTIKHIAIMGFMDSGVEGYFRSLFVRLLLSVVVAGFLNSWGGANGIVELFNITVTPLFNSSIAYANDLMNVSLVHVTAGAKQDLMDLTMVVEQCDVTTALKDPTFATKIVTQEMIDNVDCMLRTMGAHLKAGMIMTYVLFNLAIVEAPFGILFLPFAAVIGVIFAIPYISMLFYVPMYLLDAMTKVMLVGALLPLAAVAFVFPSTRWFASRIFNAALHSCLIFLFMGLFIGIASEFLVKIYEILLPLYDDDPKDILDKFEDFEGHQVAVVVVLPYLLMSMLGKATVFANYYSDIKLQGTGFISAASAIIIGRGQQVIGYWTTKGRDVYKWKQNRNAIRQEVRELENRVPTESSDTRYERMRHSGWRSYEKVDGFGEEKPDTSSEMSDPNYGQDEPPGDGRYGSED